MPTIGLLCDPHDEGRFRTSPVIIETIVRAIRCSLRRRSDADLDERVKWTGPIPPRSGRWHRVSADSIRWRYVYAITEELDPCCSYVVGNGIKYDCEISAEALTAGTDVESNFWGSLVDPEHRSICRARIRWSMEFGGCGRRSSGMCSLAQFH